MKRTTRVLAVALAAILTALLLGGCSQEAMQSLQQGVQEGIQDSLASAANADPATIEEMQGSVDGQTYTNTAAGITITFPEDYSVTGYEDIKGQFNDDIDKINSKITDPKAAEVQISQNIPRCLAVKKESASNGEYAAYTVMVGNMEKPLTQDILTYAALSNTVAGLADKNIKSNKPVAAKIDGMDAAYIETNYTDGKGVSTKEKIYYIYNRNYFIMIVFIPREDSDMQGLETVVDSIKIDK
jgi:hypothetical protein